MTGQSILFPEGGHASSSAVALYNRMPPLVQNLLITAKGIFLARKRYSQSYRTYLDALMRSQWFTAAEFSELQSTLLRGLLAEAVASTAYYARTLSRWWPRIETMALEELSELPMVEPKQLRMQIHEFINADRVRRYGADEGHTSGTSGAPMVWPYDWDSMRRNLAFRERQYRWAGLTGLETSIRFSGRVILGDNPGPPYWRQNVAERQWFFSVYHMSQEALPRYYEQLIRIGPAYLDGYPSALFRLARWINTHGLSGRWRAWAVITTAESLGMAQRGEIERALGCRVYDYYSSSEGAPYITQCSAGGKHVNPESGIVEILRDDGSPADPGEIGHMVVTSFYQRTLPLIRYKIGDMARWATDTSCPCGRSMPLIEQVEGREQDCLYTDEAGWVGSAGLSTALYVLPGRIETAQIEHMGHARFRVTYVPLGALLSAQEVEVLASALRARLGPSATIEVVSVSEPVHSARGKVRLVIPAGRGSGGPVADR